MAGCRSSRILPSFAMCRIAPLRVPKDDPYIAGLFHIRGSPAVRGGAECSCPPSRTIRASGVFTVNHFARKGLGPQLGEIRGLARKSIQKGAKFFLAGAGPPFASGGHCFLEEPLRIQLQRNAASQCFRGKLPLHLRIEFDTEVMITSHVNSLSDGRRGKVDSKFDREGPCGQLLKLG